MVSFLCVEASNSVVVSCIIPHLINHKELRRFRAVQRDSHHSFLVGYC
jgi:hypothetical protein